MTMMSYEDLEKDQQEILEKSDINTLANYCQELRAYEDEIAELEARMGTREWFNDQPAQDRYQALISARDNLNAEE